jgi:hypothetical protein
MSCSTGEDNDVIYLEWIYFKLYITYMSDEGSEIEVNESDS